MHDWKEIKFIFSSLGGYMELAADFMLSTLKHLTTLLVRVLIAEQELYIPALFSNIFSFSYSIH